MRLKRTFVNFKNTKILTFFLEFWITPWNWWISLAFWESWQLWDDNHFLISCALPAEQTVYSEMFVDASEIFWWTRKNFETVRVLPLPPNPANFWLWNMKFNFYYNFALKKYVGAFFPSTAMPPNFIHIHQKVC